MSLKNIIASRYPALTSRDFSIFWIGQFVSLIGTWMQNTTQPYLAYRLTGRPFDLGLISFAGMLPTLLLALPAGVIVERLDKRKIVIWMQAVEMLQAFILAYLALTGMVQLWHIIVLSFILGTASAFEITARQAMLIELVGRESLPNAIALQSTAFNLARVLGPSLAAPFLVLLGSQGEGWAFLANGVSYLFVIVGLFFVRTPFRVSVIAPSGNWLGDFYEGQKYILKNAVVSLIVLMAGILGFIGYPFLQQIPAIAKDLLAQSGDTEAIVAARNSALYTAQGVGALVASMLVATYNVRRKGLLLVVGQITFILGLLAIGLTRAPNMAFIILALMGWGSVTQLSLMNILIQLEVPDHLRGRVFSTYLWALQGVAPFGSLLIGSMAQSWGLSQTALTCGAFCLVVIGGVHLINPRLRMREA
jgi:MFS family permease